MKKKRKKRKIKKHNNNNNKVQNEITSSISFPSIMKVVASTISLDLVSIQPMGSPPEKEIEIEKEKFKIKKRNELVERLLNGDMNFNDITFEESDGYKELMEKYPSPKSTLHYLDHVYQITDNKNQIDESIMEKYKSILNGHKSK